MTELYTRLGGDICFGRKEKKNIEEARQFKIMFNKRLFRQRLEGGTGIMQTDVWEKSMWGRVITAFPMPRRRERTQGFLRNRNEGNLAAPV